MAWSDWKPKPAAVVEQVIGWAVIGLLGLFVAWVIREGPALVQATGPFADRAVAWLSYGVELPRWGIMLWAIGSATVLASWLLRRRGFAKSKALQSSEPAKPPSMGEVTIRKFDDHEKRVVRLFIDHGLAELRESWLLPELAKIEKQENLAKDALVAAIHRLRTREFVYRGEIAFVDDYRWTLGPAVFRTFSEEPAIIGSSQPPRMF